MLSVSAIAPATYGLEEVAAALRCAPATVTRKWRRLHEQYGFPRPLPGCPNVWSRAQVEAWIAAGGTAAAVEAGAGTLPDLVARQRAHLEQRYLGGQA